MGLREQALQAAAEAVAQREQAARTVLGARLTPADVNDLEVETMTPELVVFTDGFLHLAVRDGSGPKVVSLVTPDGSGGWTRGGVVESLTALGTLIAPEDLA